MIVYSEEPQSQQAIFNQQQKRARGGQGGFDIKEKIKQGKRK